MAQLPKTESATVAAIYKNYEKRASNSPPRGHVGGSVIGKDCTRELWYGFRWCAPAEFPGRVLRLFETGHREEPRIINNLRAIGVEVHEKDPETGRQFSFYAHGGHFGGSFDGVVLGIPEAPKTWHLLEAKTHGAKSFRALEKKGVKESKPVHWSQMQTYMGYAELERALYFAVNKDTDAIYTERIYFDPKAFKALEKKALRVIQSPEPLTKIGDDPEKFACKWCDFKGTCHGSRVPPANCRTCAHSTPVTEGEKATWHCSRHQVELSSGEQRRGCREHLYIPALINFAEPTDSGDGWVAYSMKHREQEFINCAQSSFPALDVPHYESSELAAIDPEVIGNAAIELVRTTFDGKVVSVEEIR